MFSFDGYQRSDDESCFTSTESRIESGNVFTIARLRPLSEHEAASGRRVHVDMRGPQPKDLLVDNISYEDEISSTSSPKEELPLSSKQLIETAYQRADERGSYSSDQEGRRVGTILHCKPARFSSSPLHFQFDAVFSSEATQEDVYGYVRGAVCNVLKGFNTTVIAYGQSATGKSYTMYGPPPTKNLRKVSDLNDSDGLAVRAAHDLFETSNEIETQEVTLLMSFLEIYNDKIRDLLVAEGKDLPLSDMGNDGLSVPGLSVASINSLEQVRELMHKATMRRTTARLKHNRYSSRSHAICTITAVVHSTEDSTKVVTGKLTLVDLPSSENINDSGENGIRRQEATRNNKDLLTLGRVILSLSSSKKHVPYRDCKLTRLLRESLGRHCCTILISCISPSDEHVDETLKTLEYAEKARTITFPVVPNSPVQKNSVRDLFLSNTLETQSVVSTSAASYRMVESSSYFDSLLDKTLGLNTNPPAKITSTSVDGTSTVARPERQTVVDLLEKLESCNMKLQNIDQNRNSNVQQTEDEPFWEESCGNPNTSAGRIPATDVQIECGSIDHSAFEEDDEAQEQEFHRRCHGNEAEASLSAVDQSFDLIDHSAFQEEEELESHSRPSSQAPVVSLPAEDTRDSVDSTGHLKLQEPEEQEFQPRYHAHETAASLSVADQGFGLIDHSVFQEEDWEEEESPPAAKPQNNLGSTDYSAFQEECEKPLANPNSPHIQSSSGSTDCSVITEEEEEEDEDSTNPGAPSASLSADDNTNYFGSTGHSNFEAECGESPAKSNEHHTQTNFDSIDCSLTQGKARAHVTSLSAGNIKSNFGSMEKLVSRKRREESQSNRPRMTNFGSNDRSAIQENKADSSSLTYVPNHSVDKIQTNFGSIGSSESQHEEKDTTHLCSPSEGKMHYNCLSTNRWAIQGEGRDSPLKSSPRVPVKKLTADSLKHNLGSIYCSTTQEKEHARVADLPTDDFQSNHCSVQDADTVNTLRPDSCTSEVIQSADKGNYTFESNSRSAIHEEEGGSSVRPGPLVPVSDRQSNLGSIDHSASHKHGDTETNLGNVRSLVTQEVQTLLLEPKRLQAAERYTTDTQTSLATICAQRSFAAKSVTVLEKESTPPEGSEALSLGHNEDSTEIVAATLRERSEVSLPTVFQQQTREKSVLPSQSETESVTASHNSDVDQTETNHTPPEGINVHETRRKEGLTKVVQTSDATYASPLAPLENSTRLAETHEKLEVDSRRCTCSFSMLSKFPEQANFFLPELALSCSCRSDDMKVSLRDGSDPLDLDSILREWQVDFLNYLGIRDALVFMLSYERQGASLAKEMRRWRRDMGMKSFRTSSCRAALHIWHRTCKIIVQGVVDQQKGGIVKLERSRFLRVTFKCDSTS